MSMDTQATTYQRKIITLTCPFISDASSQPYHVTHFAVGIKGPEPKTFCISILTLPYYPIPDLTT